MGFEIKGTKYVQKSHFLRNFCKFSESDLAGVEKKAYTERYTRAYTGWKVNLGLHEKG